MEFRDRVAEAKDTAVATASDAKATVSEGTGGTRETASEATETASTVVSTATGTISERATDASETVVERLPDRVVDSSIVSERVGRSTSLHRLTSVSYERFAVPDVRVRPAIERGGGRAVDVARGTDFRRVFRFGKDGFAYGKTFGDYVPVVGSYLPYVGFATGIGVGVLDDIDVLSAEVIADLSASFSGALERVVRSDGESAERSAGESVVDPAFGESSADESPDYLGMNFEEFAGKR